MCLGFSVCVCVCVCVCVFREGILATLSYSGVCVSALYSDHSHATPAAPSSGTRAEERERLARLEAENEVLRAQAGGEAPFEVCLRTHGGMFISSSAMGTGGVGFLSIQRRIESMHTRTNPCIRVQNLCMSVCHCSRFEWNC